LVNTFNYVNPTIYYSLYSTNKEWRKKWMPAAMDTADALAILKDYQDFSKKIIKIHYPFIANENDSEEDINNVCSAIDKAKLNCEFNLVRYNPASPDQGVESSQTVIDSNLMVKYKLFRELAKTFLQVAVCSCNLKN